MPSNCVILDVHLLLVRGSDVLLTQRRGGYGAGLWHLPSGKIEAGESVTDAVIREAAEEVGVTVQQDDLTCVHAVHDGGLLGSAPHTTLVPAGAGWCDWTFDPGEAQPRVRRPSWRAGTADFPAWSTGPVLSCQLALVVVSRPWLFPELLDSRGWTLPDGELLCDGGDPPSGRLVGYPTAVLLAGDLRLTSPELVAAHASAALPGWGPFGLTGAVTDGPTLRVPGVQAIGFVNRQLGRTPNPLPVPDPARFV